LEPRSDPASKGLSADPKGTEGVREAEEIRRLSKPFWAIVLIGAISLMAFATVVSQILDRHSIGSSEKIFRAMLEDRLDHLADITLEYGYWDDAVEHLVDRVDMKWINDTFVDYMQEELHIHGVHVLDGGNRPKVQVIAGKVSDAGLDQRYEETLEALIGRARDTPRNDAPVPAVGMIGDLAALYFASAVRMTTYAKETGDISTDHVIVFTQAIDAAALRTFSERYGLSGLHFAERPPSYWEAGLPIESIDNELLGYFVWNPELAGTKKLPLLMVALLLVYLSMYMAARLFFRGVAETVKDLEEARREAVEAKELLADQVRQDPLTGLGNRRFLDETLSELKDLKGQRTVHALLYVDLDNFKEINDSYGHETGDMVLQHVAVSLKSLKRRDEKVFRLGGDEFIVILGNSGRDRALRVARTIIEQFRTPVELNGADCHFGASVGVAFADNPDELLRQADMALYSAKRRGRGQYAVFSTGLMDIGTSVEKELQLG